MNIKVLLTALLLSICITSAYSQKTEVFQSPEAEYLKANELFAKEKYGPAQHCFQEVINAIPDKHSEMRINAEYYVALCAIELFHDDAGYLMKQFIQQHPANLKVRFAYFQLGRHLYYKRNYNKALTWFDKVDVYDLTDKEKHEYYFKMGYCAFKMEDYEKAKKAFYEIIDIPNKYKAPANYYYAHIAYLDKNYETALAGFKEISNSEIFAPIAPYYITHIYYQQGKYDKVIEYSPNFLDKATTKRAPEIAKIIGIAYFEDRQYEEAIPYLEKYQEKTKSQLTRDDFYQLGYAYYMTKDYEKSILAFERLTGAEDSLSQNAYYHLADCYLKTGKKKFARNTFYSAYKMDFSKRIKENSLFNYAKLSYELAYDPYNEAIASFQKYINDYPESPKVNEARQYLVNMFLTTKNFKAAYEAIEKIEDKDIKFKTAYQKITYYRGVEFFIGAEYDSANSLFNKSLKHPEDESILARALYWKGESYYRKGNYDEAIKFYNAFLLSPGAFSLPVYYKAHYNSGYAHFKKKEYDDAIVSFRKFLNNKNDEKPKMVNDAYLRVGDCYFITKKYEDAIDYYEEAYKIDVIDGDYALFQRALAFGVLGRFNEKVMSLSQLIKKYPKSAYKDDAKYELGTTYMVLDENEKALKEFNQVIANYPLSSYAKKSLLKTGLIHYNSDNNQEALTSLKKVVNDFPGTPESKEALITIRNIYVDMNKAENFFEYAKTIPFANVSNAEQDSITYIALENRFMDGDCESTLTGFENYIEKFPNGAFVLNAHYYKAECHRKNKDMKKALDDYEYVIQHPRSKFAENALLYAAEITFDMKNYKEALEHYSQLHESAEFPKNIKKSEIGIMHSLYKLTKYKEAIEACDVVLANEKISGKTRNEAYLIKGNAALQTGNIALAQTAFGKTADNSQGEAGAEANYKLAEIYFNLEEYEKSQKYIYDVIDNYSSYNYWFAKSYILLADNYTKTGNLFQARHTLQSIIDNYQGDELLELAHKKLNKIRKEENKGDESKEQEEIELEFDKKTGETKEKEELFKEF